MRLLYYDEMSPVTEAQIIALQRRYGCTVSHEEVAHVKEYDVTAKQQTGRTTRMIQHAIKLSGQGLRVIVLFANERQAVQVRGGLTHLPYSTNINITTPGVVPVNWQTMTVPDAILLVDHYVIESRFRPLLDMLVRYEES